ncbi:exportin-7-like [Lates japonicus]
MKWRKMADHVQKTMNPVTSQSAPHVEGLAQLEILCKQLYETTDTAVRHQAEKALVEFTNSPDCLSKCQLLLERGSVSDCYRNTHIFY